MSRTDYDHSDPMGHRTPIPEPLVRFCPSCSLIGPVDYQKHRDCCPDGSDARMVPVKFAQQCRDTFQIAIRNIATPTPVEPVKEADVSAIRDAALEEAAKVVEAEFGRVMAAQYPDAKFGSMQDSVNTNIRMTSVLLPEVAAAIRALRGGTP